MQQKITSVGIAESINIMQLMRAVQRAITWVRSSGIQNISDDAAVRGSFNAWYEQDKEVYPFVYSEITGYLVTLVCYLWKRLQDERYLTRAQMAGDWLLNTTHEPNGGFRCRAADAAGWLNAATRSPSGP